MYLLSLPKTTSGPPSNIHVSTAFFPAAILPGVPSGERSDLIFQASDSVFFYCHKRFVLSKSSNNFGGYLLLNTSVQTAQVGPLGSRQQPGLHRSNSEERAPLVPFRPPLTRSLSTAPMPSPTIIAVDETSEVLNILLHVTYNISAQKYGPRVDVISGALSALVKYGLPLPEVDSELWTLLLRHVNEDPLRVYALGASYGMENVCIGASEPTLKISLSSLSESQAVEIGPLYLRRLFFLHLGRVEALKRILGASIEDHSPTAACSEEGRDTLQRNWSAARAEILSKDLPQNTSKADILSSFGLIFSSTVCMQCKEQLQRRVEAVVRDWDRIKRSI